MAMDASGDSRCGIGARLRAARERAGLSLLQAAEKLHVDAAVVEALETENFDALGAPVFVRGHLRRYAELVNESGEELNKLYATSNRAPPPPDLTRIPKSTPAASSSPALVSPGLAVVVAVAIIGAVWWVLNNAGSSPPTGPFTVTEPGSEETQTASAEVENPQPSSPPPATRGAPAPRQSSSPPPEARVAEAETPPAQEPSPPEISTTQNGEEPANPATVAPATAGTAVEPGPVPVDSATPPEAPLAAAEPATTERARGSELTLRFAADSWVEVYDARGNRLFYDVGSADSVQTLSGSPPFRVVLGNAPGVALEVNGRAANVPDEAGAEGTVQFTVNRSGRVSRVRNGT